MRLKPFYWMLFALLLTAVPATAQDTPQVVIAANIRQLQSVAHIDFADLPEEAGVVDKGWLAVSTDGGRIAMLNRDNGILFWDINSGFGGVSFAGCQESKLGFIDGSFYPSNRDLVIAVYIYENGYAVGYHLFGAQDYVFSTSCTDNQDIPVRVWVDNPPPETAPQNWFELLPQNSLEKPYIEYYAVTTSFDAGADIPVGRLPSGPENDPESFLRIGRIDPPLAITVTQDGLVKRWNLETGEVTAQAQIDTLPAAGQLNANGRYLAWADQQFEALHLLDFETTEDRVIAPLQGTYIPFILLSSEADVIIGVNVGLEPIVAAWDTATGERIDLGEYRACNRQPDMVRLSKDGTTLVVGCDTGLDVWRIP